MASTGWDCFGRRSNGRLGVALALLALLVNLSLTLSFGIGAGSQVAGRIWSADGYVICTNAGLLVLDPDGGEDGGRKTSRTPTVDCVFCLPLMHAGDATGLIVALPFAVVAAVIDYPLPPSQADRVRDAAAPAWPRAPPTGTI